MATWQEDARQAALAHGLDPNVFTRQMGQEAHGADLTSPAGAQGPAQFMPGTAASAGLNSTTVHQRVPSYNAAAKLMAGYVKKYGSYTNALVAYNAGPGRVGQSLPAETQGYIKTILGGKDPGGLGQPVRASSRGAAPTGSEPSSGPPQITGGGQAGDFTSLLGSLLARPQQQQAPMPIAPPAFAAHPNLPQGFSPAASIAPVQGQQQDNVGQALSLVQALGATGPTVGSDSPAQTADAPERGSIAGTVHKQRSGHFPGTRAYPLGETGKVIGTPYAGTHTLGNWQSDNAVDIGIPVGTPMLALQDGVVVKVTKHPQGSGRFAGDQITIRGKNGNEYFYAHGVANVKAGQTVSRGDVLGKTGSANGVAHLHFGQMRGDPRSHAG